MTRNQVLDALRDGAVLTGFYFDEKWSLSFHPMHSRIRENSSVKRDTARKLFDEGLISPVYSGDRWHYVIAPGAKGEGR